MKEYYKMSQIKSLTVGSNADGEPMFHVELHKDAVPHPESKQGPFWTDGVQVWDRNRGYLANENKLRSHYYEYVEELEEYQAQLPTEANLDELKSKIVNGFHKHWELNDRAHRIEHFEAVNECALYINNKLGLEHCPKLILLAAFFHDLFAWSRFNHEILSHEWVATTDHEIFRALDFVERDLVAMACAEHRASYDGDFSSSFSELISSADRGFPGDVPSMLNRAVLYRLAQGASTDEATRGAVIHLKEKYGTGGYARYPDIYMRAFGDELAKQRLAIDTLTC